MKGGDRYAKGVKVWQDDPYEGGKKPDKMVKWIDLKAGEDA